MSAFVATCNTNGHLRGVGDTCMMCKSPMQPTSLSFTVMGRAQPQGSMKAFMVAGKPRLTSDNPNLKSWRQDVSLMANDALRGAGLFAGKHVPVSVDYMFVFAPPAKLPKGRTGPVVKPDLSKLIRAAEDAMTGIVYHDDAQIVLTSAYKVYGYPPRTEIVVRFVLSI